MLVGRGDEIGDITNDGQVLPGSFTPGSFTPGSFTPGSFTPGSFTPGSFTPGSFTPGSFTPGSFTPGSFTPGSFTPGSFTPGSFTPGSFTPFISELFRPPSQLLPGQIFPGATVDGLDSLYDPRLVTKDLLSPYAVNPFQLYPISQRSFTGASGTGLADINIDELGLGPIAEGLKVAGSSANRGTDDDVVVVRVDEVGAEVYVVVIGANGEFSADPYALQIEASVLFDSLALEAARVNPDGPAIGLFGGTCSRGVRGGSTGAPATTFVDKVDQERETLFVTSWERLASGDDNPGAAETEIAKLVQQVGGAILDVGDPAFALWDGATCDPNRANAVAHAVRAQVLTELAKHDYEHVVVVGGDDVIPFRRVIDETGFANETQYAMPSFLDPGQPLFASKAGGFNLTDAHLTDAEPTPWRGRSLWVADTSTSRLVESEAEIAAQAAAFVSSGGTLELDLSTALVTGSEFFADGATEIADVLRAPDDQRIIDPAETNVTDAETYRCALFGTDCPPNTTARTGGVNSINAHFQHFVAFSPLGAENADSSEVISTTEVDSTVAGTLFMTIGCHGGLAVPDDEVLVDDLGDGVRSSLDWAQALARQQAVMIGNTGYGLGETEGIAYTELLHRYIAEELLEQPTVGDAVNEAVKRYLLSVTQFDEYHEKTLIQTVLYGLPFYGTGSASDGGGAPAAQALAAPAVSATLTAGDTFVVDTVDDAGVITLPRIETTRGSYYTGPDELVLSKLNRPKQPLEVDEIVQTGDPVHGVVIGDGGGQAGRYVDLEEFDPVIQSPTSEWLAPTAEPPVCLDAWWPSTLARVNTLEVADGEYRQTVSTTPGQFRCRSGDASVVTGTQRIFDDLPLTLLSSPSDDWQAPVIRQVDFQPARDAEGNLDLGVTFVLDSEDDVLDLDRIVVLRLHGGMVTSEVAGLTQEGNEVFLALSDLEADTGLIFQLVDQANNVTTYTGKSTVPSIIEIDATGPTYFADGEALTLSITIPGYVDKVASGELVEPVWYSWDFGAEVTFGGKIVDRASGLVTDDGELPEGIDIRFENGDAVIDATVVFDGTAPDQVVATARVADSDGAVGIDDHQMERACDAANVPDLPDADLVGCGVDFDATTGAGDPAVSFTIAVAGVISPEYQYRIGFDTDSNGGVDKNIKYSDGKLSGPLDGTAVINDDGELLITVPLADVVTTCPDYPDKQCVIWQFETQGGVSGGAGQGFIDRARDDLTVTEVPSS